MIRNMKADDVDKVVDLWLASSIKSHTFIAEKHWSNKSVAMKHLLQTQANTIIWEEKENIIGAISLIEKSHICGLFVDTALQNRGVGSALVLTMQQVWPILSVKVYAKNLRAVGFYRRHGFKIIMSEIDKETGEEQLLMYWSLGYLTINDPHSHSSKP